LAQKHESTEIRRRQIIDAARQLIIRHGSENVTIRGISGEIGLSEAAIYRHFKNKRDILFLLADDIGDILLDDIELSITRKGSVVDKLNRVWLRQISAISQRRGVSFLIMAEIISFGDSELNARMASGIAAYIARLQTLFDEGVKNNELRNNLDPQAAALQMFCMIQGIVNLWALNNFGFDLKRRYNPVWTSFRQGILNSDGARVPAGAN
jgi:AcrR family transcriptional regulator